MSLRDGASAESVDILLISYVVKNIYMEPPAPLQRRQSWTNPTMSSCGECVFSPKPRMETSRNC